MLTDSDFNNSFTAAFLDELDKSVKELLSDSAARIFPTIFIYIGL